MSRLIYNGFIPREQAEGIHNSKYHHWVEIGDEPLPANIGSCLPIYETEGEDCMGRKYRKKTHMYCIWRPFMGFPTAADKAAFIAAFPHVVKDPEPFKTEL
jgi:hypothetical protein